MKFVPVESMPMYSNEVIRLRELGGRILAGYLVGGIVSPVPNLPQNSWANDTVYRVFLTPDQNLLSVNYPEAEGTVDIFPNPAKEHLSVRVHERGNVSITIYDAQGKLVATETHSGRQDARFDLTGFSAGVYTVCVTTPGRVVRNRFILTR
jgi:hypothetical protein